MEMECLADIRDGQGEVINRTQGFMSSQNMVRSSNVFLVHLDVLSLHRCYTGGPITTDHGNTVKAYSSWPSILERGHSWVKPRLPRSCLGALGSTTIFFLSVYMPHIFILSWPLSLHMGLARQKIR